MFNHILCCLTRIIILFKTKNIIHLNALWWLEFVNLNCPFFFLLLGWNMIVYLSLSLSFSLILNSLKLDCGLSPFSFTVLHSHMLFCLLLISSVPFRSFILNVASWKCLLKAVLKVQNAGIHFEFFTSPCNYLTKFTRPFTEPLPPKCL